MKHECPRCKNTEHPNGAKYCQICGLDRRATAVTVTQVQLKSTTPIDVEESRKKISLDLQKQSADSYS